MIPDDLIDKYLDNLLNHSDPGSALHQMFIASADPGSCNAFGLPDPGQLKVTVYAIAPTGNVEPEGFIAQTVRAAIAEQAEAGLVPMWVGLAMEVFAIVDRPTDEVAENRGRRMLADGQLEQHPDAVEVTMVYAACRDGRRWLGQRILTGPRAGETIGVTTRIGPLEHAERRPVRWMIRAIVGLGHGRPPDVEPPRTDRRGPVRPRPRHLPGLRGVPGPRLQPRPVHPRRGRRSPRRGGRLLPGPRPTVVSGHPRCGHVTVTS